MKNIQLKCRCDTRKLYDMWFEGTVHEEIEGNSTGIVRHQIAPFRSLKPFDFSLPVERNTFSKAANVMSEMVAAAKSLGMLQDLHKMTREDRDINFQNIFLHLCLVKAYPQSTLEILDQRRVGDKSFITIYEAVCSTALKKRRHEQNNNQS